jgi:hypothetical protein
MPLHLALAQLLHVCLQALVCDVLEGQYTCTLSSSALQPYTQAPELLQFCSSFAAEEYLACRPSARMVQSDVDLLGSWLAQLSASGHHISIPCIRAPDSGLIHVDSQSSAACGPSLPRITDVSSSNLCVDSPSFPRRGWGLLEVDVSSVRPELLKAGRAAFK